MRDYEPLENEEVTEVKPIGIKYVCPFCHEGDMRLDQSQPVDPSKGLFPHKCQNPKCEKTMELTKVYPYIEWLD